MSNILAIGAHPDDIELGCGGTIAKHISLGDNVYVIILTRGEKGNHEPNMIECINSMKELGVNDSNIIFGDFPDGNLNNNFEVVNFIESHINQLKIDRVYTHYPFDRHQDHSNCSKSVSSAARKVPGLLLFEGPSTHVVFEPHYFVEISETDIEKKMNALKHYKSQMQKRTFDLEWVKSLALVNGLRSNTKFSEAFALNHLLRGVKDV